MRSDSGVSSGASAREHVSERPRPGYPGSQRPSHGRGIPARSERRRGGELVPEETAPKSR